MISLKPTRQASSKAPRKMVKMSAGKRAAAASKVGKKVSAKNAVTSKKPVPKSNKGVSGKAKAGKSAKKSALKVSKGKAQKK